jgi:hypothetical protein
VARTRELIHEQIPDLDPDDQRLIDPVTNQPRFGDEFGDSTIARALIVNPDRREILGPLSVSGPKLNFKLSPFSRQSRISMAENGISHGAEFRPRRFGDPEPTVILDRQNVVEEGQRLLSEARHSLQNSLKHKTTTPLHGMEPLSATHKIFDSRTTHEIQLVSLRPPLSDFKKSVFNNGNAGFRSPYELRRIQKTGRKRG